MKDLQCQHCEKIFKQKATYDRHMAKEHPTLIDPSSNAPKNPQDATVRTSNPQVHEALRSAPNTSNVAPRSTPNAPNVSQLVAPPMKMQKREVYESDSDDEPQLPKTHDERLDRLEEQHDLIVSEINRIKNLQKHIAFTLFKIIMDASQ